MIVEALIAIATRVALARAVEHSDRQTGVGLI
jgi:hypothetical protein